MELKGYFVKITPFHFFYYFCEVTPLKCLVAKDLVDKI